MKHPLILGFRQLTNEVYREDKFIWTILDKEEENKVKEYYMGVSSNHFKKSV